MRNMMTGGVIKSHQNENRNKINKNKISGRRTAERKFVGSSSVVGSVKKTTEEVTEIRRPRVAAEAIRRRIGRGPECPLTGMDADMVGWGGDWTWFTRGDSRGAIALLKTTKDHGKVKHIDIRHHYLRDLVKSGVLLFKQIPSSDNLANLFTKPLACDHHHHFLTALNIHWGSYNHRGVLKGDRIPYSD